MKNTELVAKALLIARDYKTLYIKGCFGAPLTSANKTRYLNNNPFNAKPARAAKITAASSDTFGFDCVCLIKGILWGWSGDKNAKYGGATYLGNGVPDVSADGLINLCNNVSTHFDKLKIGEALWMKGHVGIYVGNGLAVECTPAWSDNVQITAVANLGQKSGYHSRKWSKHGEMPWVEYEEKGDDDAVKFTDLPEIKSGSKGDAVKIAQAIVGTTTDGIFGAKTKTAVIAYQKKKGLTADGVVGKKTWEAIGRQCKG